MKKQKNDTTIKLEDLGVNPNEPGMPLIDMDNMPVLALRGSPVFSGMLIPVGLARESSLQLVDEAEKNNEVIALVAQRDSEVEAPGKRDLYPVGVLGTIMDKVQLPDGNVSAVIKTGPRVQLKSLRSRSPYLRGRLELRDELLPDDKEGKERMAVLIKTCMDLFDGLLKIVDTQETKEMARNLENMDSPVMRIAFICANSPFSNDDKFHMLEMDNAMERYEYLARKLSEATQFMRIRSEIQDKTAEQLTRQQRDHFLQQQIRTIQEELGSSVEDEDADELAARARKMSWSKEARQHFEKELRKLDRFNAQNPEYSIQYQYLDTFLSLPWNKTEKKAIDVVGPDYIPYTDGKFLTPSEKAEFWVRSWKEEGFDPIASYARAEEDARNDNELARKYPLFSVQQKTYRSVHSTFNNLEWMDEVCDQKPVILMNLADAAARGIQDGDAVVVFNDRGEHHGVALVNDLIKPGVVGLQNGWWEQQGGSSSHVTNDKWKTLGGTHCCNQTLVDVKKEA